MGYQWAANLQPIYQTRTFVSTFGGLFYIKKFWALIGPICLPYFFNFGLFTFLRFLQFQMTDDFSELIQRTLQPLLYFWENQPQTTRVGNTDISPPPSKITHTNHTFWSLAYNSASLLMQSWNFSIHPMKCWYPKSRETIYLSRYKHIHRNCRK